MNGVSININLPDYGHFSPEELTRKVKCFAMELVGQSEKKTSYKSMLLQRSRSRKASQRANEMHR